MTIKKRYVRDVTTCNVTFTIEAGSTDAPKTVSLVGDFNNWNPSSIPMTRRPYGRYSKTLELPCGKSYEFRYLLNDSDWRNDSKVDRFVLTPFGDSENSVVDL